MRLYVMPRSRSIRPHWLLEELGIPYDITRVDPAKGDLNAPAFRALNPRGEVPVLVDDNVVLTQCLPILLHLGDRSGQAPLAPPVGTPARAMYYEWLTYAECALDPVVAALAEHAQAPVAEDHVAHARRRLGSILDEIAGRLADRIVLVGETFTAADVSMASILHWANGLKLLDGHPRIVEYMFLHCSRPAVLRAFAR